MKKVLSTIGIFGILLLFVSATPSVEVDKNPTSENEAIVAPCVTPKGQLQGKINQLEAQGYIITDFQCAVIDYFVQPDPPYASGFVNIEMKQINCPGSGMPCTLESTAFITADIIVQNNSGTTKHTNVEVLFAL